MNSIDILFVLVGERDAKYFSSIAQNLSEKKKIGFIIFNDSAIEIIKSVGNFPIFNMCEIDAIDFNYADMEKKFSFIFNDAIRHETNTFYRSDAEVKNKLAKYIIKAEDIFSKNSINFVIQEIGGYCANLSIYFVAKYFSTKHIFLEPSFFSGYVHVLLNSREPPLPKLSTNRNQEVDLYLKNFLRNKTLSFSSKDSVHYNSAFKKFFIKKNWYALTNKLINIFLKRRCVEHRYWFNHIYRYLMYFFNSLVLNFLGIYKNLENIKNKNIVYFPLHVPDDLQLTTRCPELYNQVEIIKFISSILPHEAILVIKEHPAMQGSLKYKDISSLVKNQSIVILSPNIKNFDIFKESELVVTINSKSGFEALFHNKKVICLSHSFYSNSKITINMNLKELREKISEVLLKQETEIEDQAYSLANGIYEIALPMNLYDNSKKNIENSANSIIKIVESF